MPLHARLVHDWAASWVFAATDAQHTLQERTGVGQRPAAESGMPRSICYLLPWPPGWCCSRQPCSCGGETTAVWTRRNIVGVKRKSKKRERQQKASFGPHRPCPPQTSSPAHQVPHREGQRLDAAVLRFGWCQCSMAQKGQCWRINQFNQQSTNPPSS